MLICSDVGWVLWVSLAVMLGDSLTSLTLLTLRAFYQGRKQRGRKQTPIVDSNGVPHSWWITGLVLSTGTFRYHLLDVHLGSVVALCTAIVSPLFSMAVYQPGIAVLLAALVSILAVRAMGETDLNPASGIGKISQVQSLAVVAFFPDNFCRLHLL